MPKKSAKPARRSRSKSEVSPEFKLAAFVVFVLGALFLFDFVVSPQESVEKFSGITGEVVSEVQNTVEQAKQEPLVDEVIPVKILSPASGSVVDGDFTVSVQVPKQAKLCYYLIKDDGMVKWDRRTRSCGVDIEVTHCKTSGADKCYFYYDAQDALGNSLGYDEAYFAVR